VARRLLPSAILLPVILGWLHEVGERTRIFDPPVGAGLVALAMMFSLVAIVWWVALALNRADDVDMLVKVGYKPKEIMTFMQANHSRATFAECCLKLDLCKVWNIKVCDCYYDGQIGSKILPVFWSGPEINAFRKKVRKHNQIVNFGIDPEVD
jgi:hypothetical protein